MPTRRVRVTGVGRADCTLTRPDTPVIPALSGIVKGWDQPRLCSETLFENVKPNKPQTPPHAWGYLKLGDVKVGHETVVLYPVPGLHRHSRQLAVVFYKKWFSMFLVNMQHYGIFLHVCRCLIISALAPFLTPPAWPYSLLPHSESHST